MADRCQLEKAAKDKAEEALAEAETLETANEVTQLGSGVVVAGGLITAGLLICAVAEPCGLFAAPPAIAVATGATASTSAVVGGGMNLYGASVREDVAERARMRAEEQHQAARGAWEACMAAREGESNGEDGEEILTFDEIVEQCEEELAAEAGEGEGDEEDEGAAWEEAEEAAEECLDAIEEQDQTQCIEEDDLDAISPDEDQSLVDDIAGASGAESEPEL